MNDSGGSTRVTATAIEQLAAYAPPALLASGVLAALSTVVLVLTFATEASPIAETTTATGMTLLDRAGSGLIGVAMLVAILGVFRLHQSWRTRAPSASSAALVLGVVSLLAYGALLLVFASGFKRPADLGVSSVVTLGGVGLWIFLVSLGRADVALAGGLRWLGLAIGVGLVLLAGGSAVRITDPKALLQSPLLLVVVMAGFIAMAIGYPIWAIWLGRRWRAAGRRGLQA